MAEERLNTTASLSKAKASDRDLTNEMKTVGERYKKEKKVKVSIPKALEKNIGTTLYVQRNGTSMNIPVDGQKYDVPESFAKIVEDVVNRLTT